MVILQLYKGKNEWRDLRILRAETSQETGLQTNKKRKWEMPDTYVILFAVLLMAVAATYFVPAGAFEREIVDEVERVVPGTYSEAEGNPTGFMDIFLALQEGMVQSGGLIF